MKLVLLWGPVLLVMGLIFFFSSLPDPGGPPGGISDKTAHVLIYAALGASLVRALAGGRITAMTLTRILFAAALGTLYGVSDEIHQHFVPPRTPDILDVAADAVGALVGAMLMTLLARLLLRRLRST
ncbi:MAG TPA: VanZ family protein [Vicinamibacterales bacterium]|nr:VanZ family protein [Vicinamibacterales bacterium]